MRQRKPKGVRIYRATQNIDKKEKLRQLFGTFEVELNVGLWGDLVLDELRMGTEPADDNKRRMAVLMGLLKKDELKRKENL